MNERGSVTLIVAASLAFAAVIGAFGADVTRAISARGRAQAAADAAALAAAQELLVPSGRSPGEVAAEYAERGGARLESWGGGARAGGLVLLGGRGPARK
jgi:uncharacterized membrane protein